MHKNISLLDTERSGIMHFVKSDQEEETCWTPYRHISLFYEKKMPVSPWNHKSCTVADPGALNIYKDHSQWNNYIVKITRLHALPVFWWQCRWNDTGIFIQYYFDYKLCRWVGLSRKCGTVEESAFLQDLALVWIIFFDQGLSMCYNKLYV